ncbi:mechanosensitive ion channel protein MscS [Alsobacter metallidurans]|uniref:Mechanosensitive ion channel protein MscS n=1 Tax=Alsobacter metallidurans TaxID=340221 RepID=A0A917MFL0_9HYPH|nr:mechanosensitive ion channel family protein [Alsobacter metallidurans]GGH09303.1 mechanosensitive ion channel protein MscS [Alsobacter metallidurans]
MRLAAFVVAFTLALLTLGGHGAKAADPAPPIRVIIEVPNDEAGRNFVTNQLAPHLPQSTPAQPAGAAAVTPAASTQPAPMQSIMSANASSEMSFMAADELQKLRQRARALIEAAPSVPADIAAAGEGFVAARGNIDWLQLALASALLLFGGVAAQRLAWWGSRGMLNRLLESPGDTVQERLRLHGMRVSLGLFVLAAFLLGSIAGFVLVPWPPVIRETVIILLAWVVILRLAQAFGRVIIAPGARHDYFRVVPLTQPVAWFWYRTLMIVVALLATIWATISLLNIMDVPLISRQVVMSLWITVLAATLLIRLVVRTRMTTEPPSRLAVVLTASLIVIAWVLGALHLRQLFWTLITLSMLPLTMRTVRASIRNIMGPQDSNAEGRTSAIAWAVVIERATRVGLVVIGATLLANIWRIDITDIAMGESPFTRVIRAFIRVVIIMLVADLVWKLVRAVIDGRLDETVATAHDDSPEGRRRSRLNTLLPILRNFIFAILLGVAFLMVLDAMGIQIGPLLAGAGVLGIAVGFGAQTLVKDVISGIFYLLDDAFRVGEYITAGAYKGTVESFSLRSVKLRHHRGPITTVPFGVLGAVQNLSRDWVIDKISVGVTYDTDLDKVKKLVKEIGKKLQADPEYGPQIIEPLKMQGVEHLGDFSIELRLKMMTKPGEQFVIRRQAYALLKRAFEENGIHFAFPTVQVAGGQGANGDAIGAAAQRVLDLRHQAAQAASPAAG